MLDHEVTSLRDALKRFDAWVGTTIGGKDDHISGDLMRIGAVAREHLAVYDKGVTAEAEAKLVRDKAEEVAKATEAKRATDAATKAKTDAEALATRQAEQNKARVAADDARRAADTKAADERRDDGSKPDFSDRRDNDRT